MHLYGGKPERGFGSNKQPHLCSSIGIDGYERHGLNELGCATDDVGWCICGDRKS